VFASQGASNKTNPFQKWQGLFVSSVTLSNTYSKLKLLPQNPLLFSAVMFGGYRVAL
jgi:hypothetical protein